MGKWTVWGFQESADVLNVNAAGGDLIKFHDNGSIHVHDARGNVQEIDPDDADDSHDSGRRLAAKAGKERTAKVAVRCRRKCGAGNRCPCGSMRVKANTKAEG